MKSLCIMVEGRTECNFAKNVLADHLFQYGWIIRPITLITGKNKIGVHKGGWHHSDGYKNALKQIYNTIMCEKGTEVYTTFFDLYGFPSDIPCFEEAKKLNSPYEKAKLYEKQIKQDINHLLKDNHNYNEAQFIPYVQPYEFECFLFVDPHCSASELSDHVLHYKDIEKKIRAIALAFETPEHINNSPVTAPSKRIEHIAPGYVKNKAGKAGFGWKIARDVGLFNIRQKCFHFNEWLTSIEEYK